MSFPSFRGRRSARSDALSLASQNSRAQQFNWELKRLRKLIRLASLLFATLSLFQTIELTLLSPALYLQLFRDHPGVSSSSPCFLPPLLRDLGFLSLIISSSSLPLFPKHGNHKTGKSSAEEETIPGVLHPGSTGVIYTSDRAAANGFTDTDLGESSRAGIGRDEEEALKLTTVVCYLQSGRTWVRIAFGTK